MKQEEEEEEEEGEEEEEEEKRIIRPRMGRVRRMTENRVLSREEYDARDRWLAKTFPTYEYASRYILLPYLPGRETTLYPSLSLSLSLSPSL